MPGKVSVVRPGLIVGPRRSHRSVHVLAGARCARRRSARPGLSRRPHPAHRRPRPGRVPRPADRRQDDRSVQCSRTGQAADDGPDARGVQKAAQSDAAFTWADAEFLEKQGVHAWSDMPAWVPTAGDTAGFAKISNAREQSRQGLSFLPITDTAKATLEWFRTLPEARASKAPCRNLARTRDQSARGMEGPGRQAVNSCRRRRWTHP